MENLKRSIVVCLLALCSYIQATADETGLWDFKNMNPSSLSGLKIEGAQKSVASTNSSISMFVIAKSGKFAVRTSDVQLNAKTYLRIPVKSTSDVVTVVAYPGYANFKINGKAATSNTTTHTATSSELTKGYVEIAATSTTYLYSVKVVQKTSSSSGSSSGGSSSGGSSSGGSSSGSSSASSSNSYDLGKPFGWAMVGGSTTGSNDKNAVTVTNINDFVSAMSGTGAKTIYVKGTITVTGQVTVQGAQNKTVYGLPGSSFANTTHTSDVNKTGILFLKNCKNIILRNLTFKGAGAYDIDGKDNLTVQNCQYLWVDHCDFQDGVDGNFDCNNGSDNISVTWCRFRYLKSPYSGGSGGSNDHRFSDLWGGSDKNEAKDGGKLRTTFANCWWDEGCKERMPRVRFGQVHILNCLYSSSVANYCIGAAYRSNIYVENTAFTSTKAKKTPWKCYATSSGYTDYNITLKGCQGASDQQKKSGSISYFVPSKYYSYTAYDASKVESVVSKFAGATLSISVSSGARSTSFDFEEGNETTGIDAATTASSEIVATRIFTANGAEVPTYQKGLNIVKTTYANGKTEIRKIMVK